MNIIQEQYLLDSLLYERQILLYNDRPTEEIDKEIERQKEKIKRIT